MQPRSFIAPQRVADSMTTARPLRLWPASRGLRRYRHLPTALGGHWVDDPQLADVMVGWGLKASGARAAALAQRLQRPCWRIEDGFIRSVGLGVLGAEPFGFAVDEVGIYYDATRLSGLEQLLLQNDIAVDETKARALMARICRAGICKYNDTWRRPALPHTSRPRVLVVDQTVGDQSIALGYASAETFQTMLDCALREHPDAEVIIRTHPDVIAGKRRGYLQLRQRLPQRVTVYAEPCNPYFLLEEIDHVYVVTSQLGFEALLAGKPVTCFGLPFYAGWGLTDDRQTCSRRRALRSRERLFVAAMQYYCRYINPVTGEPCSLDELLTVLEDHARIAQSNRGSWWCVGMRWWRRPIVRAYMMGADRLRFVPSLRHVKPSPGDQLLFWGFRQELDPQQTKMPVARLEDGFIRSVGLGSDMVAPCSLVLDRQGMYFHPHHASALEDILLNHEFSEEELARGQRIIDLLVTWGITKYNAGHNHFAPSLITRRPAILVPGQVEDDQSIIYGTIDIKTNADLLLAVRQQAPEAFVIYKPHPDVVAGNRRGQVPADVVSVTCDAVIEDINIDVLMHHVDAVHTMTSLAGFEALLRQKSVVCYGQPFYAGWGLTIDRHPHPRRNRRLSLQALVYGTLVLYARYRLPDCGLFVGPEAVIQYLSSVRQRSQVRIGRPWLVRQCKKLWGVLRAWRLFH